MAIDPVQRVRAGASVIATTPSPEPRVETVLPDLPRPVRVAQNQGIDLPPPVPPTLRDIQRMMRERLGEHPGSPQWQERERQRLEGERYRGDDGRFRDRQWRDDFERRELERRRLERR